MFLLLNLLQKDQIYLNYLNWYGCGYVMLGLSTSLCYDSQETLQILLHSTSSNFLHPSNPLSPLVSPTWIETSMSPATFQSWRANTCPISMEAKTNNNQKIWGLSMTTLAFHDDCSKELMGR